MSREVPEWIGKTDNTALPPRVKIRVFDRFGGKCAECGRKLGVAGEDPEFDHITALINGGENRETNFQCLCRGCHRAKTNIDVATKSKDRRVKAKHLGIEKKKQRLPGSKGTKWKRKVDGTVVPRN